MLGIDKRGHAAHFLRLGDDLQRDRGFAGGLRSEDFDNAASRNSTHAQRRIEGDRSGGDDGDGNDGLFAAQAHDRSLAKLLFNLGKRKIDCARAFFILCHTNLRGLVELNLTRPRAPRCFLRIGYWRDFSTNRFGDNSREGLFSPTDR